MATVKVNKQDGETPSQAVVRDANRVVYVKDGNGRALGVRQLDISRRLLVMKALPDESIKKQQLLGMYIVGACCCEIDGDPIGTPRTELQFDALMGRLGDDGFVAVGKALQEHFGIGVQNEVEIVEEAKK